MITLDRIHAGVVATCLALLGTAALSFGSGRSAAFSPCNDGMGRNDVSENVRGTFVGAEAGIYDIDDPQHQYYCFAPSGGEANQTWIRWDLAPGGDVGYTARLEICSNTSCTATLSNTGAHLDLNTSVNIPFHNSTAQPGGGASAGIGSGTCVYVDSATPTCPTGTISIVGVTVHESDATVPTTHPNMGACVTVPGDPCFETIPDGIGVRAFKGDATRSTVTVTVGPTTQSQDIGSCYGVNAGPGCT